MTDHMQVPPAGIDVTVPNAARMYDYYLGGKDNFAVDREAAEKIMALGPSRDICQANREFLGRAVRYAAGLGIDQFLDIGTGLPNQNNVHEVARRVNGQARVVYVDYDPVVTVHGRALLPADHITAIVEADLRKPEQILADHNTEELIDFGKPLCLVLVGVLHCLTDRDDPWGVVQIFAERMVAGSHLIISHLTDEHAPEIGAAARNVYDEVDAPLIHRGRDAIARMFTGFDLVEPGVTHATAWRPDHPMEASRIGSEWWYVGVGRKP